MMVGALVAGLALAGCGGGSDGTAGGASTSTDNAATTVVDTTDPAALDSTSTTDPATASTTDPAPAPEPVPAATDPADDDACLVGDWVVEEAQMNAYYAGLTSTIDAPITIEVTGNAPLSFAADGTYGWAPDFALMVEVAGQRGTGVTGGSITGNWTAVDGVVTTTSDVNALTMSITVGGATMDGSDLGNGLLDSSPINGVTYSCDGPTPVLDFMTGDPAVTIPVTLTSA